MEQNKIENLLVAISEKLEHMETKMNSMENDFSSQMKSMENDLSLQMNRLTADVSGIKVTLENETNKKLQMLAEGFQSVPELSDLVFPSLSAAEL